jgi:hypothetical protein
MSILRYAFVLVALSSLSGCRSERSPFCPQGTSQLAARSLDGRYVWCESSDKVKAQWVEFHEGTTKRRQSCSYSNSKPEGSFTAWHPDGKTWVQGQFSAGHKIGKWKQWDSSGNLVAEGDYNTGRLVAGAPVAAMAGCEKTAPNGLRP